MTLIYNGLFSRTLDTLIADYACTEHQGCSLEIWVFDSQSARKKAEDAFSQVGIRAQIHSAYKPLLHFFLEHEERQAWRKIVIRYPVQDGHPRRRFLLETYPLAALVGQTELVFEEGERNTLHYEVSLTDERGRVSSHKIFAPNHSFTDSIGVEQFSPTGWLRLAKNGAILEDRRLETDYERIFSTAIEIVQNHPWGHQEPYFEVLKIDVGLPCEDCKLGYGEEVISLREALHEDLYFSLLEIFQQKSGRPLGDRGLQPGQIIPCIIEAPTPSLRIEKVGLDTFETTVPEQSNLAQATAPLGAEYIRQIMTAFKGDVFTAQSRSGRVVMASYHKGSDPAVIISAGQHANETTGIVGALRAATKLSQSPNSHFVISPLENPDGYELHHRLRQDNPAHMHHAARYTALGDDLEYRTEQPLYEKAIRLEAEARSGAQLHVNLHGYPSHEWTRPLSGYVPRGFEMWTIPKGFFLIMRHHADWAECSRNLIKQVTEHLMRIPGLAAFNRRQIDLYTIHAGQTGFEIINDFPCLISQDDRHTMPVTLITEYPDETIYKEAFIAGHTAQMETVLAAYEAWRELVPKYII